jgi:hypothetical protein
VDDTKSDTPTVFFQTTGFLSMKMGCGIVSNVRSQPPFGRREEILDMLEEKGLKQKTL